MSAEGSLGTQPTGVRSRTDGPFDLGAQLQCFEGPVQTCQLMAVWGPRPQAFVHEQMVPLTWVLNFNVLNVLFKHVS